MNQYRQLFLDKYRDNLNRLTAAIAVLDAEEYHPKSMNTVFRTFHNIKSNAAFMGYPALQELAGALEQLCEHLVDHPESIRAVIPVLRDGVAHCETMESAIRQGGNGTDIAPEFFRRVESAIRKTGKDTDAGELSIENS